MCHHSACFMPFGVRDPHLVAGTTLFFPRSFCLFFLNYTPFTTMWLAGKTIQLLSYLRICVL
jgi:hypothetical protein